MNVRAESERTLVSEGTRVGTGRDGTTSLVTALNPSPLAATEEPILNSPPPTATLRELQTRLHWIDSQLAEREARAELLLTLADRAAELDDRITELVAEASPEVLAALGIEEREAVA